LGPAITDPSRKPKGGIARDCPLYLAAGSGAFKSVHNRRALTVTEPLASEFAIEAGVVTSPMGRLVSAHGVIALGITEKVDTGHVDVFGRGDVTSPAAAVNDIRTSRREKVFGMANTLHGVRENSGLP
jgi:hypothetical protein